MEKESVIRKVIHESDTFGEKASDSLTKYAGSWTFILSFGVFLVAWMYINIYAILETWDPYPFILLNLVLSCLAAIQAPIILMSQNRQTVKDRNKMEYDYKVNRRAERGIEEILRRVKNLESKVQKKNSL